VPREIHEAPSGPKPLGPYSIVAEAGGLVFLSGMVAIDPATGESVRGGAAKQAEQIMRNIGAVLGDVGLDYGDVVKTTIFVTDMQDFAVVNDVYGRFVGQTPPARSTVEVSALPGGFSVEIETIAAR
jgi:2-iminobutanoate/2-iminopropanoate deaminase